MKYNIHIDKGATFSIRLKFFDNDGNAIDLADYTPKMQLRRHDDSALIIEVSDFTITANQLDIKISKTDTLTITDSTLVYNLDISKDDDNLRLLKGKAIIDENVNG